MGKPKGNEGNGDDLAHSGELYKDRDRSSDQPVEPDSESSGNGSQGSQTDGK
jgi:hypothetical protein